MDTSLKLIQLIDNLKEAQKILGDTTELKPDSYEIQCALTEVMGLEDSMYLVEACPDTESIVRLVGNYNFKKFRPELLETIEVSEDIFPPDMIRILEEQRVKKNGKVWQIHQNDADPFPSNPHAHNYAEGVKLDLSTGFLYRDRKQVGKLGKKEFLAVRGEITHPNLPPLAGSDANKAD